MASAKRASKVLHPYGKRRDKSMVLIGSDGRQYHQKIAALMENIKDPGQRAQIKVILKNAKEDKERLTLRSLESKLAFTRERKFLINAGYDEITFEKEYGFSIDEFEDEDNWIVSGDRKYFRRGNEMFELFFDYSGQVLRRVKSNGQPAI